MTTRAIRARDNVPMLVEHRGMRPEVDPSAWVAPTAVVCGDVRIGADARILWNAVVTAEDGRVEIGERCVVMEHALVRGRAAHPVTVVHVNSTVAAGGLVLIGWVAVGDQVLSPDRHEEIWAIQRELDFPGTVYGEPRGDDLMARVMPRQTAWLAAHCDDRVL
jgi:hypothetical protein